ncbi:hypothetical protein, partial [Methanobrevibacter sp.]|uniref:hypothetical protein n=1 Tax=Methanobrevibacter sp. TaxID=66852 RepID=UPI0038909B46
MGIGENDDGLISINESNVIGIENNDVLSSDVGSFSDLEDLIDDADDGDTIILDRDYNNTDDFSMSGVKIDKDLIIDGQGHTLDGNGISRIFKLDNQNDDVKFEVRNIVFVNGFYDKDDEEIGYVSGAAIFSFKDDSVTAINCTFIHNNAGYYGGAMYMGTALNCTFIGNSAYHGGATAHVNAKFCRFEKNDVSSMYKGSRFLCLFDEDKCVDTEVISPILNILGDTSTFLGGKFVFDLTYDDQKYDNYNVTIELYKNSGLVKTYYSLTGSEWTFPVAGNYDFKAYLKEYPDVNPINGQFSITSAVLISAHNFVTGYNYDENLSVFLVDNLGNPLPNFTVSVEFDGIKDYNTDKDGYFFIPILNLVPDTYDISIKFAGKEGYSASNESITLVINKGITRLISNRLVTTYSSDEELIVTLMDFKNQVITNANVEVKLNGTKKYITDKNGQIKVPTKDLTPGTHFFNITFAENEYYLKSNVTADVLINKINTKLTANPISTVYNVENELLIFLFDDFGNPLSNKIVSVDLNGTKKHTTDKNGQIKVKTKGLVPDVYVANVAFGGDDIYQKSNTTGNIVVNKDFSKLIVNGLITTYDNDDEWIIMLVNGRGNPITDESVSFDFKSNKSNTDENGQIIFSTNMGESWTITLVDSHGHPISDVPISAFIKSDTNYTSDENGQIKFTIQDLIPDTYFVNITFSGNKFYSQSNAVGEIVVKKEASKLIVNTTEDYLLVTLISSNEDSISNVPLSVALNGTKNYTTDEKGQVKIGLNDLDPNTYVVNITFKENAVYLSSNALTKITVNKRITKFILNDSSDELLFTLVDMNDHSVSNVPIFIDLNGKKEYVTDENGQVKVLIKDFVPDTYVVNVTFKGNEFYLPSNATYNVIVEKTVSVIRADDMVKYYHGSERLSVALKDALGNPLSGSLIHININDVIYDRITDDKGEISLALNIDSGNYSAFVSFDGDKFYKAANATVNVVIKPTIIGEDITKIEKGSEPYVARFLDSEGKPLVDDTTVQFNINGVLYNRVIKDGIGKLNINLAAGNYIITATNPSTGESSSNSITILPRIIENRDIIKYFKNGTQYTVKVLGDNGKPVGAGKNVTFNINGVFYTRQTNESGIA